MSRYQRSEVQAEPRRGSTDWNIAGSTSRTHDVATGNTDSGDGRDTDTDVGVVVDTHEAVVCTYLRVGGVTLCKGVSELL